MGKNVIILGAGFSCDAGVPLMARFVETMWHLATNGHYDGKTLTEEDRDVFARAVHVRNTLDGYHGRANFDDRNIEDVLSILSFNAVSGSEEAKAHLEAMNRAITRTIELTCAVKHSG